MLNGNKHYFLSFIGAKGYKLVRSLAQNAPSGKSYDELTKLMKDHLQPKPNEIAQRYMFYKCERKMGESIKDYVAELRKLSEHCNFGEKLDESLCNKLVCGLNNEKIQQRLLATRDLDLKRAMDTAVAMEAATRSAKELHGSNGEGEISSTVHKLDNEAGRMCVTKRECYRCGSTRHLADACAFKNQECFGCKQIGHIRKKCHSSKRRTWPSATKVNCNQARVDLDADKMEGEVNSCMNFLSLYPLGARNNKRHDPVMLILELNGVQVEMEIDTGAAVSVMSYSCYDRIRGGKLDSSDLQLRTYTGEVPRVSEAKRGRRVECSLQE